MVYLAFMVLVAGALVSFSIQNAGNVAVSFLLWRFDMSVSTLTVAAALAGIIMSQLLRGLLAKRQKKAKSTVEFVTRRHY